MKMQQPLHVSASNSHDSSISSSVEQGESTLLENTPKRQPQQGQHLIQPQPSFEDLSIRSSTSSRSASILKRCSSADSRVEPRSSINSLGSRKKVLRPLRQCLLHRSSSSAAAVPTGWWHQPQSDLWNERYQMASYLCSVGRFGKLYSCFSEATGEPLTVKVVRKSRWNTTKQQHDWIDSASAIGTTSLDATTSHSNVRASASSLDRPKINQRPGHYLSHPHRNHLQEYAILKALQHPNILEVYDLIEDPRHYYVVTQHYDPTTQSLHAHLQEREGPLTEQEVAPMLFQMLSCIHYCHSRYVVHCNLQLDAFVVIPPTNSPEALPTIRLTDFGNAVLLCDLTDDQRQAPNLRLMEPRGTIRYMAPEVVTLDKSYGPKCDVWSLGIISYVLLTGAFPLDGSSFKQVQELVLGTLQNPQDWLIHKFRNEEAWQNISDECKHLVHRLLAPLEHHRPTPEQALQHPWMQPHWSLFGKAHRQASSCGISSLGDFESVTEAADSGSWGSSEEYDNHTGDAVVHVTRQHNSQFASSVLTSSTVSQPLSVIEESGDNTNAEVFPGKQLELQQIEAISVFLQAQQQIVQEWDSAHYQLSSLEPPIDIQHQPLQREQVRTAYQVLFKSNLSDADLNKVFADFDATDQDSLSGLDFFVAFLNEKDMLFTHSLQEAFEVFDTSHSGLVSTLYMSDALRTYAQANTLSANQKTVVEDLLDQVETDARESGTTVIALEEMVAMILESSIPKPADAAEKRPSNPQPLVETRDPATQPSVPLSPSWESNSSAATHHSSRRSFILDRLSLKFSAKHFIAQRPGRLSHHYELTDFVNEGGCGAVWFCTHKETGAERAVKLVRKSQSDADYNRRILDEFLILRELDHPNILKQYELFEDSNFYYIVMDAARGGDLCDELDEFGAFLESAAAILMKQLLSCINYLHISGFVHCDLKPENILLEANKELSQIKIIDFGFAANITKAPNQRLSKRWGTLQYTAPEVFAGDYGKPVDLWSAGVICFLLLSDEFPFFGDTKQALMQNVKRGGFSFSSEHWSHVSELGKDFVSKLLTLDEDRRLSAEQALNHPWIRLMTDSAKSELKPTEFHATANALSNLMKFSAKSKLKQATYMLIASQLLVKEEKQAIAAVFKRLDKSCNGRLSRTEIRLALRNFLGIDLSDKQVDDLFRRVDVACTGYIEYSEFLIAAMSESWLVKTGKLRSAFDVFDVTKTGFITIENLKVALAGFLTGDDVVDNALIAKIVREVDLDRDNIISYFEFEVAMLSK